MRGYSGYQRAAIRNFDVAVFRAPLVGQTPLHPNSEYCDWFPEKSVRSVITRMLALLQPFQHFPYRRGEIRDEFSERPMPETPATTVFLAILGLVSACLWSEEISTRPGDSSGNLSSNIRNP